MLVIVKTQDDFQALLSSVDWHSSYVSEVHMGTLQYVKTGTANLGATLAGENSLLRLLISLPEDTCALEIVVFNSESFCINPDNPLEEEKTALIKRRLAEADFGAFRVRGACLAYQKLDLKTVKFGQYYSSEKLYDDNEDLCAPYNSDWRAILDGL